MMLILGNSKTRKVLGWKPTTAFERAFEEQFAGITIMAGCWATKNTDGNGNTKKLVALIIENQGLYLLILQVLMLFRREYHDLLGRHSIESSENGMLLSASS